MQFREEINVSYPRDLDEYEARELTDELARRETARQAGVCDYCGRAPDTKPCKFPERHRGESDAQAVDRG
jgi:hypothetical protein